MNSEHQSTLAYFRSRPAFPWEWSENGSVVVLRDGTTVAFREEIVAVLGALDPGRLPPFGSIVLFFMACRNRMPKASEVLVHSEQTELAPVAAGKGFAWTGDDPSSLEDRLDNLLERLAEITRLPESLRSQVEPKCLLAEAIFEDSPVPENRGRISLEWFARASLSDDQLNAKEDNGERNPLLPQLDLVVRGFIRHSFASLELRARTGLEALPDAAEVGLLPCDQARRLIEVLTEDSEQRMVGRAVRELMAAVRLPRNLSRQEELPSGGVADLSNRGPLDRLLLSELAHDDLTLTMRIALNESLYLRHELSQDSPPTSLSILLDSGLRIWGLPRVFATATALAMVASETQAVRVRVWRAHGYGVRPVDLLHREGLIDHLGRLEIESHPGAALGAFAAATTVELPGPTNSVLITHADVLEDAEFRRFLSKPNVDLGFIATVDREGRFALRRFPLTSQEPICSSRLDLDQLLALPKSSPSLKRASSDPNLPALLNVEPCPILLPFAGRVEHWTRDSQGHHIAVLSDRRLVEFTDASRGGRLLVPRLPSGKTIWMERIDETLHLVRSGASHRPNRLLTLEPGKQPRLVDLCAGEQVKAVVRSGDALLVIRERDVYAYSLRDGELLERMLSPHRWHRGRYFCGEHLFYFVHWNGTALHFDPVTIPERPGDSSLVTIFDREGHEGPWALNQLCQAFSTDDLKRQQVPLPIGQSSHKQIIHISRDGHRIYVTIPSLDWHTLYDLRTETSEVMRKPLPHLDRLDPSPPLPAWNLFRTFDAIATSPAEPIRLRSRKGTWRSLTLEDGVRLRLTECRVPLPENTHLLQHCSADTFIAHGCSLEIVDFPSRSRVFLDSRGMLHLKSHLENIPEVTLVLSESEVAAWCSDQTVCGPAFFFEDAQPSNAAYVFEQVMAFAQNL